MIFYQMKNSQTILSYTISDTIASGMLTICGFLVFVPCILSEELDLWLLILIGSGCIFSIVETLRCAITDFTIVFDEEGFIVKKRNRITSQEGTKLYKWKEISGLSFMGLYSKSGSPRLVVFYKGGGYDNIRFRYTIKHREFVKLAKEYSGSSNIVYPVKDVSSTKRTGSY